MAFDRQAVIQLAASSEIAKYRWKERGRAPVGYVTGMAVAFARTLDALKDGDAVATAIAAAPVRKPERDVLEWYGDDLKALNVPITSGPERLLAIFAILLGLGMRESSGRHCEGRDISAENVTAATAEAGLFQVSYNSMKASPLLRPLYDQLKIGEDLLTVFDDGVECSARSWEDWGEGEGRTFQTATKRNPLLATLYAGILLRVLRKHWGPINKKRAEVTTDSIALFRAVQNAVT